MSLPGAPGFIIDALMTGVEFIKGWEKSLFITKWSMHQLVSGGCEENGVSVTYMFASHCLQLFPKSH